VVGLLTDAAGAWGRVLDMRIWVGSVGYKTLSERIWVQRPSEERWLSRPHSSLAAPKSTTPPTPPDFIGTSGYASTAQNVVPASHEVSTETVAFEFLSFGM